MIEKIYYDENNYITLDVPDEGAIGCYMSGGADSSLLCYLLAATIRKNNLETKFYPITAEYLKRPYGLKYSTGVVDFVSSITGFQFDLHLCFPIQNHNASLGDTEINAVFSQYSNHFLEEYSLVTIFSGNTANPPIQEVPDTDFARRPKSRDDLNWRRTQESNPGMRAPFLHVDKKVIAALYKKFGLLDTLLPLTRSCEAELVETEYFTKDCSVARPLEERCWWCAERAWGFNDQNKPARAKQGLVARILRL